MYLEVTVVLLWDLSFLEGDRRYPRTGLQVTHFLYALY